MAGLPVQAEPPGEADFAPTPLAPHPTHPVFPDIAAVLDIAPSGAFRNAAPPGGRARVMGNRSLRHRQPTPYSAARQGRCCGAWTGCRPPSRPLGLAEAHAAPPAPCGPPNRQMQCF